MKTMDTNVGLFYLVGNREEVKRTNKPHISYFLYIYLFIYIYIFSCEWELADYLAFRLENS